MPTRDVTADAANTDKTTPTTADKALIIDVATNPDSLKETTLSDLTKGLRAASETVTGVIEVATAAETTTGTDATRAVSPDGLAGSQYGVEVVDVMVFGPTTVCSTGDGKAFFRIPVKLNGWNLVGVAACVYSAGTTGTMDIQIRNKTDTTDMLSTKITIDSTETDTSTAATPAVVNASFDDVVTGDAIAIDIDAVHTTQAQGLVVELRFQLP